MFGVALAAASVLARSRFPMVAAAAVSACVLLVCCIGSFRQAGRWHDTISLYSYTAQQNPRSWLAPNCVGVALMKEGKLDEAEKHLVTARDINENAIVDMNLGALRLSQNRPEAAIELLGRSVALEPTSIDSLLALSEGCRRCAQWDQARATAQRAVESPPDDSRTMRQLASVETARKKAQQR